MTSPVHHSHPGGNQACQRLYGDLQTFVCPSCRRTCGPCLGAADDRPELCDDCRAEVASSVETLRELGPDIKEYRRQRIAVATALLTAMVLSLAATGCSCETRCYESAQPVAAWWAASCHPGATVELVNGGRDMVCRCKAGGK